MKNRLFFGFVVFSLICIAFTLPDFVYAKSASSESIKIELSCTQAPGTTIDLAMAKFKSLVEKDSNGHISVTLYPAGQLYNPKTEIEAIVKGALTIAPLHPAFVGARSPVLEFIGSLGAQGCWIDRNHYWKFTELSEIRKIADREAKTKINAKILGMPSGGPSLICNRNHPIHTVDGFKGLKTRAAGSSNALLFRTLGMIPVNMSAKEVYMALQRGTIDGAVTTVGRYIKSKWYEVAPYLTVENSVPDINSWFVINLDFWNELSPSDQQILSRAAQEIVVWSRQYSIKEAEESYKKLQAGLVKDFYFFPKTEVSKINKMARPAMHNLIIERTGKEMGNKIWDMVLKAEVEN